jgi:hypothetical protein
MMTRKRAAEYFVVAWAKDWSLRTYLHVIADGGAPIPPEDAHSLFPWLPGAYTCKGKLSCRAYLAETNRPLSDALWRAGNDSARLLALAAEVEAFTFTNRTRAYANEASTAARTARREFALARLMRFEANETKKRLSGHHWKVCK